MTASYPKIKRSLPIDVAFVESDFEIVKQLTTESNAYEQLHNGSPNYWCNLHNCNQSFHKLSEYDAHQQTCHRFACSVCQHLFPTNRLLDIHYQESHDNYFKLMAQKGRLVYECYIKECGKRFDHHHERNEHMIEVHQYPHHYRLDFVVSFKKRKDKKYVNRDLMEDEQHPTEQISKANRGNTRKPIAFPHK
jgi:hypothetical protein